MVRPSPTGQYNILCNHLHFNEQGVQEVMPVDTKYIAIVRHPGTCFLYLIKSRSNNGGDSLSMVVFVQFLSILTATQLQRTAVEITF